MNFVRGHDRGGGPQEGVSRGRGQSGQGARRTREARGEVQQELQDTVKKYELLECDSKTQASELAKAHQSARDAQAEAQSALQEIQAAKKIAAGKAFIMQSKSVKETFLLPPEFGALQGHLRIFRAAYRMLLSSIKLKKGVFQRNCSGPNTSDQNIRCPSATS